MKFSCPSCGYGTIEEIMVDVVTSTVLIDVSESGDCEYGEQTSEDGFVDRYQCEGCGWIIKDANGEIIKDPSELYAALTEQEVTNGKKPIHTAENRSE